MIQSRVFIAIFAIWCNCVEKSLAEDKKPALIIDRLTGSIIDLPPDILKESQFGSWANACPAQSATDVAFIAENGLTENALFIQQICAENETLETAKFERDICSKYFQMSVVFNKTNLTLDFGYEVYVLEENQILFSNPNQRKHYIKLKKLLDLMNQNTSKEKVKRSILDILLRRNLPTKEEIARSKEVTDEFKDLIFGEKNTYPHDGQNMSFMWISVFEVEFDFKKLTPKRIFYQVRNNNRWPVSISTSCQEYKLANEVYEKFYKTVHKKADIKFMYSSLPQKIMFVAYELPKKETFADCIDNWVCMSQWPLVPIDQFHFNSTEEKICSPMATIPIWTSTLGFPLIKVDKFLYALFQAMGSPLHIIAGIKGQLRLKINRPQIIFLWDEKISDMYMDSNNKKIPIPEIIYKLVKYKPDDCLRGDSCWYSATIIIHNNPFFNPAKDKLCPDVTAKWGWRELILVNIPGSMEQSYQTKYIYVCKSKPKLLKRLMGVLAKKEPKNMKDFNLTELTMKGHSESVESEVLRNLLVLTEAQRKLMESLGIPTKLKKENKYLDQIAEEDDDITDDDDSHVNSYELLQSSEDTGSSGEGIKRNDDTEERPLWNESMTFYRKLIDSIDLEDQPLLQNMSD